MTSRPPLIGIDGYNLALEEGTGVATYARNLAAGIEAQGGAVGVLYGRPLGRGDALSREIVFFDSLANGPPARSFPRTRAAIRLLRARAHGGLRGTELALAGRVVAAEFEARLPRASRLWNVDNLFAFGADYFDLFRKPLTVRLPNPPQVMHWTYPLPIRVEGAKNIYTLHDLVPLRLPYTTLDRKKRYLRLVRMLAREADHLVTVSEASKRDIVDILGVPEERVTNTYQAVSFPTAVAGQTDAAVRDEITGLYDLEYKGYFLFFGAIEPKKNVGRMLQAFLAARVNAPLVVVGKLAWKADQEMRLFKLEALRQSGAKTAAAKKKPRLLHVEYVPFAMLATLIRGARGVLFPSLYEGFGLPVLEAMTLGAPVITSTEASLPEVAGDAALLVDPYRPAELTEAIRRLDADAELRADLAARGVKQAERFAPDRYQARLRDLYGRLGVPL